MIYTIRMRRGNGPVARRFMSIGEVWRIFAIAVLTAALGLLVGCTDYDVPGGDKPWPKLSDFPDKPDATEMAERRRALFGRYGNYEKALPDPTTQPARPPKDALRVAVIQFPRAGVLIDEESLDVLSQVAAYAQQSRSGVWLFGLASQRIELASGGTAEESSRDVGAQRVRAVAIALARAGVPIEMMKLVTRGSTDPLYVESAPAGEAGNRRVEIYFTR